MRSYFATLRQLVLPAGAGPGTPKIVLGPDLPPPLKTYLFYGSIPPTAGIVFYGTFPADDTYTFLVLVQAANFVDVVIGHVVAGVMVELRAGFPAGQTWRMTLVGPPLATNVTSDRFVIQAEFFRFVQQARVITATTETMAAAAIAPVNVAAQTLATAVASSGEVNARYEVTASVDFEYTVAGNSIALGQLQVDGVVVNGLIVCFPSAAGTGRWTVTRTWTGVIATTGNHTFDLIVKKTAAAATINANAGSVILVNILE